MNVGMRWSSASIAWKLDRMAGEAIRQTHMLLEEIDGVRSAKRVEGKTRSLVTGKFDTIARLLDRADDRFSVEPAR